MPLRKALGLRLWHFRGVVRLVALCFVALPATVQAGDPPALQLGPVYTDRLPELQVVLERAGQPGEVPRPEDVALLLDGRVVGSATTVSPLPGAGRGTAIAVAVDVSPGMCPSPPDECYLDECRQVLATLLSHSPEDRLGIVAFADDDHISVELTQPGPAHKTALGMLGVRGQSRDVFRGLNGALSMLEQAGDSLARRRALLLVGRGGSGTAAGWPTPATDELERRVRSMAVIVDVVIIAGPGQGAAEDPDLDFLATFAEASGGQVARAHSAAEARTLVAEAWRRLREPPVATFRLDPQACDGRTHRLTLRVSSRDGSVLQQDTQAVLRGRRGLTPGLWAGLVLLLLAGGAAGVWALRARSRPAPEVGRVARPLAEPVEASPVWSAPPTGPPAGPSSPTFGAGSPSPQRRPAPPTRFGDGFSPPAIGRPAAVIMVQSGPLADAIVPIETDTFWIGAAEGNSLVIASDDRLSSHHACLRFEGGRLVLYDNDSTNGTYLNERRIGREGAPVKLGDRLRLGASLCILGGGQAALSPGGR